jgi:cobalt-zinc-cadmium resistance protein CzcA
MALMLLLVGCGYWAFRTLETEAYPEFTAPKVRVITLMPGKGAEEVERLITVPLEKELNGIPGEITLRSTSIFGLSVVSINFEDHVPITLARQQVLERVNRANLPSSAEPRLDPESGAVGEIYRYTVESKYYSPMTRKTIEDWDLEKAFKQIPGVIDVVSFGGPTKTFQVNIDPGKLRSYGVTLDQVFQAVANSNATTGGNYIENNSRAYIVRGLGLLRNTEDIGRVVVFNTEDGIPIRVKDIATVDIGPGIRLGQFGKNDDDDAVMGIVLMRRGENPSVVVERLYKKFPEIQKSLPKGIRMVPLYDRNELVRHTLETIGDNVAEGIFLVVVLLIVFLFDIKSGFITAAVIPLALCFAFICLRLFHIPANLLSLGAIDFGIIVDGAVIMVESAFVRLSSNGKSLDRAQRQALVLQGVQQVGRPIVFATAIIIVGFLPIFGFGGVAGKLFSPLAFMMSFALLGAVLATLAFIPTLIAIFLTKKPITHRDSPVITAAKKLYEPILSLSLRHSTAVLLGAVATLVLSAAMFLKLGSEFLPPLDEGNIWLRATVMPPSVSLEQSVQVARQIRSIISTYPEVRNVTSQTGSPDDGTDANLFNNSELLIDLKPAAQWRSQFQGEKAKLIADMNNRLSVIPNVLYYFSQYIQDNVDEAMAGAKGNLVVKIYGPDIEVLQRLGDKIASLVRPVPGLVDVASNQQLGQPQYVVEIDREAASRYGVNVSDVQELIETAVGGQSATQVIEGEHRFNVLVRFGKDYRSSQRALDNLLIDPPGPIGPVPLVQLARIKTAVGASLINRENNSRVMLVRMNVRGRDLGSAAREAQQRVSDGVELPEGYQIAWGGQYEYQQEANQRLMIIVPITLLVILSILMLEFGSAKKSLMIMATVPLAAVGGIAALHLTGTYFSISAGVGFIALAGVAVQNGIIMVSYIDRLRRGGALLAEAVYCGALALMRPVLMAATVAIVGLIPAALSTGIGSQSQKPFAIVIIGGLVSATILTLIVLPVLYKVLERDIPDKPEGKAEAEIIDEKDEIFDMPSEVSDSGTQSPDPAQHVLSILLVAVISMLSFSACTSDVKPPTVPARAVNQPKLVTQLTLTPQQERQIALTVGHTEIAPLSQSVESMGRVQPDADLLVHISTPVAGRVISVDTKLGQTIAAGQQLALIKSDSVGQLQSDLLQSVLQLEAEIKQQEVQMRLSKSIYARETQLFNDKVSAKADLEAARTQLEKDEANLAALHDKHQAAIATAQERLSLVGVAPGVAEQVAKTRRINPFVSIRAPRGGLIIARNINAGELADPSKELFTVADLSNVWLIADIFEKDMTKIRTGQTATVSLDSLPGASFPASITYVANALDPHTRTLAVRADVPNLDFKLKPGMFARISVNIGSQKLLLVPFNAVQQNGDNFYVYVPIGQGTYDERQVKVGLNNDKFIQILEGLRPGEKVVVSGTSALQGLAQKLSTTNDE